MFVGWVEWMAASIWLLLCCVGVCHHIHPLHVDHGQVSAYGQDVDGEDCCCFVKTFCLCRSWSGIRLRTGC